MKSLHSPCLHDEHLPDMRRVVNDGLRKASNPSDQFLESEKVVVGKIRAPAGKKGIVLKERFLRDVITR